MPKKGKLFSSFIDPKIISAITAQAAMPPPMSKPFFFGLVAGVLAVSFELVVVSELAGAAEGVGLIWGAAAEGLGAGGAEAPALSCCPHFGHDVAKSGSGVLQEGFVQCFI